MAEQYRIGRHVTFLEEPDILYLKLVGAVSEEEGFEINRRNREVAQGRDRLFYLIDLEDLEGVHPVIRKDAERTMQDIPLSGVAIVKASLKAKVIANLVLAGLDLFRPEKTPVEFFAAEEAARDWIAEKRIHPASRCVPTPAESS